MNGNIIELNGVVEKLPCLITGGYDYGNSGLQWMYLQLDAKELKKLLTKSIQKPGVECTEIIHGVPQKVLKLRVALAPWGSQETTR